MPIVNVNQSNFASGELSPKVWGRFGLEIYKNGVERMQNFIAELQGSARYRTGTRYVNHTRLNQEAFLIPFQFNDEQSYVLEFTEGYIRFFKDEGVIVESDKIITGASQEIACTITSTAHGYDDGDEVFISGIDGMTELDGKYFLVNNKTTDDYEITDVDGNNINSVGFSAFSTDGFPTKVITDATRANPCVITSLAHGYDDGDVIIVQDIDALTSRSITGATKADPCVLTVVGHGYTAGTKILITGVVGMTQLNGNVYKVSVNNITTDTFEITDLSDVDIDSTGYGVYTSDGTCTGGMTELNGNTYKVSNKNANNFEITDLDDNDINSSAYKPYNTGGTCAKYLSISEKIYEIWSPYIHDELHSLKFAQNADTMRIVHPNLDIRKLTRSDHTSWTLSTFSRTSNPFPSKSITGATKASPCVITAVAHGYSNGDIVAIHNVFGMVELNHNLYKVASQTTDTFRITDLNDNLIDSSSFGTYTSGGKAGQYPSSVAFFEGRLFYAGTPDKPETFWGSMSPNTTNGGSRYNDFTTGTDPEDSVVFTLSPSAQGSVDHIEWLAGGVEFLLCGTFGGITKITGDGVNEPITPTSINAKPVTGEGVADQNPIPLGSILMFTQRGNLNLRSFEFDVLADGFVSVDRNLVSDHMTQSGIIQIAFQNGRPDILWGVRNDGVIVGITFKAKEDVSGWHRHILGGTNAKVKSVSTIAMPNEFDQIWLVVERTINGVTRRSIEFFEDEPIIPQLEDFYTGKDNKATDIRTYENAMFEKQKEYIHVDSALTYDGTDAGIAANASMTPSAITGIGITFTASQPVFTSTDVGREIWKKSINGVGEGRAEITGYSSTTVVTCTIKKDFDNTNSMIAGNWYLTTDSITSINHLEGETVSIVADGSKHESRTVTNAAVTLNYQASKVHIGLGYIGLLKSLNLEGGASNVGSAQTRLRNIVHAVIKFFNTLGAKVGTDRYSLEQLAFRSSAHLTNRPSPLFSGNFPVKFPERTDIEKHFYVEQANPLPCNVQYIDVYMDTTIE